MEGNENIENTDISPDSPQQYTNPEISSHGVTINTLIKNPELHHDIVLDYRAIGEKDRALLQKQLHSSDIAIRAYRDTDARTYKTLRQPHTRPLVFQNMIVADISDKYTTISKSAPRTSLRKGISYTFVNATKEKVHTLLTANQ